MKKIIKIILLLTFTLSLSLMGVFAEEKIKIGLLVPLTGQNSEIGQSIIKSTRLAVNQINSLSIEIIPKDTASNPEITLRSANELNKLGVKKTTINRVRGHPKFKKTIRSLRNQVQTYFK